jgi:hypothetical protein
MVYLVMANIDNKAIFMSANSSQPYTDKPEEAQAYCDRLSAVRIAIKENEQIQGWQVVPSTWVSTAWMTD